MAILVIDDEPLVLRLECLTLERAGFHVLAAANRSQAIGLFEAHRHEIDLAVIDVSIAGDNGFEIASALKELRPGLKMLFVSGYPGEILALQHGVDVKPVDLLVKPFVPAQLVAGVKDRLATLCCHS